MYLILKKLSCMTFIKENILLSVIKLKSLKVYPEPFMYD